MATPADGRSVHLEKVDVFWSDGQLIIAINDPDLGQRGAMIEVRQLNARGDELTRPCRGCTV